MKSKKYVGCQSKPLLQSKPLGLYLQREFGIFLVDNKFKSEQYKQLLETSFLPEIRMIKPNFTYMQDNASVHKAAIVMNFIQKEKINVLDWLPRSPDLNVIENVWAEMQRLVNKHLLRKRITNRVHLFTLCKECFGIREPTDRPCAGRACALCTHRTRENYVNIICGFVYHNL